MTSPLHSAAKQGDLEKIKEIIPTLEGGNVDILNKYYETPLLIAAREGHLNVVKFLYKKGGNIDYLPEIGISPVGWAASRGHGAIVKFLCHKGADHSRKICGLTPLDLAATKGYSDIVKLLENTEIF